MDADCQYQAQGVTAQEQMRGCLRLAEDYLEQLRALGVYDRSAVLILADHGTETVHRPLLLLKRPGDTLSLIPHLDVYKRQGLLPLSGEHGKMMLS